MRPKVYLAGPMSADASCHWAKNCLAPLEEALTIQKAGAAVHCPLLQGLFYHKDFTHEEIMPLDLTWLGSSDMLFVMPGFQSSKGTLAEIEFAKKHSIPTFYKLDKLIEAIKEIQENGGQKK